jgi:AAA+ ATPase superfamily predicted ATPase
VRAEHPLPFIGRRRELSVLAETCSRRVASLIVITGRRRVGKSRLIEEFSRSFAHTFSFLALPPPASANDQREEFARQLAGYLRVPGLRADNWSELFSTLADHTGEGQTLVVFDEISWMAAGDRGFLGKLKNAWDTAFKRNSQLALILCGSVSSWIDENLLSSTGFVGRVTQRLVVRPLPLASAVQFWGDRRQRISAREKLKVLSVTGGIPRYLEEIDPRLSAEENIGRLCFREGALLFDEFERLFSDLFGRRQSAYRAIVEALVDRHLTQGEILARLDKQKSGTLSRYLGDLVTSGFIARDFAWKLSTGEPTKTSTYRLADNYVRFYLKYIARNRAKIVQGGFPDRALDYLPAWEAIMGLSFENLVLSNRDAVFHHLHLDAADVVFSNPFLQKAAASRRGVQIDLLIQARFQTLYLCEIKFSSVPIDSSVIAQVASKSERLARKRGFSLRPVLIHAGEVSEAVVQARYFDRIIDLSADVA